MSNLANFLKQMGTDSALRENYVADPDGTMQSAGLTQEEMDAVKAGDKDKIRELTGSNGDGFDLVGFHWFMKPDE
ncbi:MAG: hypothetical protein EP335_15145 [Alphaproteobacteria bacterium]|nr:MAG: hypothetical protein EP335_15145 [Alphaproteobacteria bacterium]